MRTQEELDILAELGTLSHRIYNAEMPRSLKRSQILINARVDATHALTKLGYSRREIMKVLGLKSPQSVQRYLSVKPSTNNTEREKE